MLGEPHRPWRYWILEQNVQGKLSRAHLSVCSHVLCLGVGGPYHS